MLKRLLKSPNFYSLVRVFCIVPLAIFFYCSFAWSNLVVGLFFIAASLTDLLDGILARRYGTSTRFGAFIDPVADKILVAVAGILLVEKFASFIVTLPIIVIIIRELSISGLREWMAQLHQREIIQVSYLGKVKTGSQMTAISILFLSNHDLTNPSWFLILGIVGLYVAAILSVSSVVKYFAAAYSYFEL